MARGDRSPYLGIFVALVCALVFLPVLFFQFVTADDASHVTANAILLGTLSDLWTSPYQVAGLYMPATYTAWWVATRVSLGLTGEFRPIVFHALNWAVHSGNVALAFLCFRRVRVGGAGALAAGLLFGLHPIQVESVAWVTAFKDVFAGTFVLGSVWFALGGRWRLASACFVLGILAKPVGAVGPLVVGIFLWVAGRSLRQALPWLATWLVGSLGMLAWTKSLQPGPSFSLWDRARLAVDSLSFSMGKTLFPVGLTLNYGRSADFVLYHGTVLAVASIAIGAGLLWKFRHNRRLLASAGLFVVAWLPVSGAVSFYYQMYSTTADRFLYLSLLGPALAVGSLCEKRKWAPVAIALCLALLSFIQLGYWRNNLTLYGRMAQITPTAENHYRFAMALVESGERARAVSELEMAKDLEPGDPRYANNLALIHAEQGKFELAEMQLREALAFSPDSPTLHSNLATLEKRRRAGLSNRREP